MAVIKDEGEGQFSFDGAISMMKKKKGEKREKGKKRKEGKGKKNRTRRT